MGKRKWRTKGRKRRIWNRVNSDFSGIGGQGEFFEFGLPRSSVLGEGGQSGDGETHLGVLENSKEIGKVFVGERVCGLVF